MARTTRPRLSEVRVRTATAGDAKHGRQLFDRLGSNGLYLRVTPGVAKCWVQQHMVPNAATGKSRRVRIGLGAWPRVTLAQARKAAFANRCLRDEGRDPLAAKRHRAHEAADRPQSVRRSPSASGVGTRAKAKYASALRTSPSAMASPTGQPIAARRLKAPSPSCDKAMENRPMLQRHSRRGRRGRPAISGPRAGPPAPARPGEAPVGRSGIPRRPPAHRPLPGTGCRGSGPRPPAPRRRWPPGAGRPARASRRPPVRGRSASVAGRARCWRRSAAAAAPSGRRLPAAPAGADDTCVPAFLPGPGTRLVIEGGCETGRPYTTPSSFSTESAFGNGCCHSHASRSRKPVIASHR